jgi:hypothetical protein
MVPFGLWISSPGGRFAKVEGFRLEQLSPLKLWLGEREDVAELARVANGEKSLIVVSRDGESLSGAEESGIAHLFSREVSGPRRVDLKIAKPTALAVTTGPNLLLLAGYGDGTVTATAVATSQAVFKSACGAKTIQFLLFDYTLSHVIAQGNGGPLCLLDLAGKLVRPAVDIQSDTLVLVLNDCWGAKLL